MAEKCTATFEIRGSKITIPISEENKHSFEKIIETLYNNKEKLNDFIQSLSPHSYLPRIFKLGNITPFKQLGTVSLNKLIKQYLNPNILNQSNLPDSFNYDNIIIADNIFGTGTNIQKDNGELKFVIDSKVLQDPVERIKVISNIIKLQKLHNELINPNLLKTKLGRINILYESLYNSINENKDVPKRIKQIFNNIKEIENSGERLSEFVTYLYGDRKFKEYLNENFQGIINNIDKLIDDNIITFRGQDILNTETKEVSEKYLLELIKGNEISIQKLNKLVKDNKLVGDPLVLLRQWLYDFNTKSNYNNAYLDIDYIEPNSKIILRVTGFNKLEEPNIDIVGEQYFGSTVDNVQTKFGYYIAKYLGKYYVSDSLMFSSEKLSEKIREFNTLENARSWISNQKKISEMVQKGNIIKLGAMLYPSSFKNKIRHSFKIADKKFETLSVNVKSTKLSEGSIITIKYFPNTQFVNSFEQLTKKWKPKRFPEQLSFIDLTENLKQTLNKNGYYSNFFKDDLQKQKYLDTMEEMSDLEFFFLKAHDLLQDKVESGEVGNNDTIFDIDDDIRYDIIDKVLESMETSALKFLKVQKVEKINKGNKITFKEISPLVNTPVQIPKYNINRDLWKVIDHLKRHFGVNCITINNDDIKNGLEINGKKVIFPDTVKYSRAFILDGNIYLNIQRGDSGDAIHEYMHLALGIMKIKSPEKYYTLTSVVEKLPDYKQQIALLRKYGDNRSELDLQEELFVTLLGKYFGRQITLNFYNNQEVDNIIQGFRKDLKNIIIKTFALGEDAEIEEIENILGKSLEEVIENFGSMLFEMDNTFTSEELDQTILSRKLSNAIGRLIKDGEIKENCK